MSAKFLTAVGASKLYPLTDRQVSGLSHAEQISRLSQLGVGLIQLREKFLSTREFFFEAQAALQLAHRFNIKLIINDCVDIAMAVKADGVHLGQDDLPPDVARKILGAESIIGISTHTVQQAQLAAQSPVDYIAIGPIYPTFTKVSTHASVGLEGVALVREAIGRIPLVAIGGISSTSRSQVISAGADCVAVISDIWSASSDSNP